MLTSLLDKKNVKSNDKKTTDGVKSKYFFYNRNERNHVVCNNIKEVKY